MSFEAAQRHLAAFGLADRIQIFAASTATVELAAQKFHCKPEHIAKTIALLLPTGPLLIVAAGDAKIDNRKFKDRFKTKARMIPGDLVEGLVGHPPGGVCPFGVKDGVEICLDDSLKRFEAVIPACGSPTSGVRLTIPEIERASGALCWVDVTKIPEASLA